MIRRRKKKGGRNAAIGLDVGNNQIKAVVVSAAGDGLRLDEYLVSPTPASLGKPGAEQQFGGDFQQILTTLSVKERDAFVAVSCHSATVCEAEVPRIPPEELHNVLKLNSQRYLRRDLTNYFLDARELGEVSADPKAKKPAAMKLLVAAATRDEVLWYRNALKAAKLHPVAIELTALTVVNAFQISHPAVCEKEAVLLLDIGGRMTSINILRQGQPLLTRITHFGGAQLIEASGAEASLTDGAETGLRSKLIPLAREIRSSIDFFERQQDCHVSKAFAGGGMACAATVLKLLSEAVGVHIESWNPLQNYQIAAGIDDGGKLATVAPSLAGAVGAAATRLRVEE